MRVVRIDGVDVDRVRLPAARQKATFGKIRLRTPPRRRREWNGGGESGQAGSQKLKGWGECLGEGAVGKFVSTTGLMLK